MARLTTFSKLLITILIVAIVFILGKCALESPQVQDIINQQSDNQSNSQVERSDDNRSASTNSNANRSSSSSSDDDIIKIGVVTWGGYAGGQYFNEGFQANTRSRFYKDYGFQVEFKILDDFVASRDAFKNDDVNLLWATIDAFPTEVQGLSDFDPVVVFQADWSRGGDAIVARRGITKVSDLKGKKIAVAELTPSHSFLIWLLEAGGLTADDVDLKFQVSAIDAAAVFKSGQVDAAVVWSPDDIDCVQSVAGSRVLESTKSASHIIADVFMAKKGYVQNNKVKLEQLYEGWMKGAAEINLNDNNKRKAAKILAENFSGFSDEDAYAAINNVRLTTHGDNINFFGLNRDEYKGVTGSSLYTHMTEVYTQQGIIKGRVPGWRTIAYPQLVESANLQGISHAAENAPKFKAATAADIKKEALASKAVSINFRTGEFQLDENSKYIIDKEFVGIAQAFGNSRIRIEGNTDNTGSRELNLSLSKKRAQAVADYLISEHRMPKNRLIVVGNGPDKPLASNDNDRGRAKNRRTDFELVGE